MANTSANANTPAPMNAPVPLNQDDPITMSLRTILGRYLRDREAISGRRM